MKNLVMLITCLMISGCTVQPTIKERIVYVSVPIKKPVKPEIPKISGSDVSCLNQEQVDKLLKRDTIIKGYISDLEVTIESTQ